jgi:hypothetical protein
LSRTTRDKLTSFGVLFVTALLIVATAPLWIPLVVALATRQFVRSRWLRYRWSQAWGSRGKRALLVFSRSPNWQPYIETHWLPHLRAYVVTLDWSERSTWPRRAAPLEVRIFRHWRGERDFNPMAIVFPEWGDVRVIRFHQAFRDLKHGNRQPLDELERQLFADVGCSADSAA